MNVNEQGVISPSQRYFSTPTAMARELFFYITRCGEYTLTEEYSFHFRSEVGRMESHYLSFMLFAVPCGTIHVEAGGRRYQVRSGECTLLDCREPHRYWAAEDTQFLWMHFDGVSARRFYEYIMRVQQSPPFSYPYPAFLEDMRGLIRGLNQSSESRRSQLLYRLLCSLAVTPSENRTQGGRSTVGPALDYMERHLMEPLSVADIAAQVHMSPSYFSRVFRRETGCAPHEYQIIRRIDHAKYLLSSTSLTVQQIAFQSGYHSEGNFIKSFVEKVGITPSQFRKGV